MTYYFNNYLKILQREGEIKTISRFVDPSLQVAEVTDREAALPEGGKALLFTNTGTDFPIVTNLFSSERRIALSFNMESMEEVSRKILDFYQSLIHNTTVGRYARKSLFHELVQFYPRVTGVGSCQEVALFPPDLNRIPFTKNRPFDEAYSLHDVPMVIKDPTSSQYAIGSARLLWHSRSTFQVSFEPGLRMGQYYHSAPRGRVPVAFFLGGDPLYSLSGLLARAEEPEPFLLEGYLRKKAVVKVPCLSQPLEVPENCDMVIEGYIDKNAQLIPSPSCGNSTGFYSLGGEDPLVHVTCITHRKGAHIPIIIPYHGLVRNRGFLTKSLSTIVEASLENTVDRQVRRLSFPYFCRQCAVAVAGIQKFYPGQIEKTAHAFWGSDQLSLNKLLILVDENIDVNSWLKVNDCIRQYYRPSTDTFISKGALSITDQAAPRRGYGGKICIDATRKPTSKTTNGINPEKSFVFYHKSNKTFRANPALSYIYIALDDEVDLTNHLQCLWLAVSRTDPVRDVKIHNGMLFINACLDKQAENDMTRPWPNVCCSSMETIEEVDRLWDRLKVGDFVPSPSLTLHSLLRQGNAKINE